MGIEAPLVSCYVLRHSEGLPRAERSKAAHRLLESILWEADAGPLGCAFGRAPRPARGFASISHADSLSVVAYSPHVAIGVDVALIPERLSDAEFLAARGALPKRALRQIERAICGDARERAIDRDLGGSAKPFAEASRPPVVGSASERGAACSFACAWTHAEALLKLRGIGFSAGFRAALDQDWDCVPCGFTLVEGHILCWAAERPVRLSVRLAADPAPFDDRSRKGESHADE